MSHGDALLSGFTTAVRCWRCGATVPFDVRAVEVRAGDPVIPCPRCASAVDVPTFDVEFFDDFAPNTDADAPTEGASADVAAPDLVEMPQAEEGPGEVAAPVRSARAERRRAGREADGLITCRACGEPVHLESARVRLRWTHALLECPECSTEFRIRRRDAYRDIDPEFPWAFASYSTTVTTTPVAEPERRRRFWRKG